LPDAIPDIALIISRTPFRISFFGGGTDYPAWYLKHSGAVIGTAIDKYCYISVRKLPQFFEHKHRIVYSLIENVRELKEIQHPAVRAILQDFKIDAGLEIHHDGDLPARSGLGSSSSFTVGLVNVLYALRGEMITQKQLGREAIRIEQDVIQESVGSQDQVWAAHGGLSRIDFGRDGEIDVNPLIVSQERRVELENNIILFFSGISRTADSIAKDQIANFDKKESNLHRMHEMVDEAAAILQNDRSDLRELGALMNDSWRLKRDISDLVSNKNIDEIFDAAIDAGAIGGKLLGAGGGGFFLFVVPPERRENLKEKLGGLIDVSVKIGAEGSKIVMYEPNGL
jgi:D-glycero-alpha-D-manno-heptose-7-phosphate kinase